MNHSGKRLRQTTIFETFVNSKRGKTLDLMDVNVKKDTELRDILAAAAEKRIPNQRIFKEESGSNSNVTDSGCSSWVKETDGSLEDSAVSFSQNSDELFSSDDQFITSSLLEACDNLEKTSFIDQVPDFELKRLPDCCPTLPLLKPSETHTVLFRLPVQDGVCPEPSPRNYEDAWDSHNVRMPCSPENKCPVLLLGEKSIQSRWEVIEKSLLQEMKSSYDLQEAILQYNTQYASRWDFRGLHAFFSKVLKPEENAQFFQFTLPAMVRLALQLPQICTQPIPLLKRQMNHAITFTQKQIACLLSNAFFCTFPRRNVPRKRNDHRQNTEFANYPDINFNRLYSGTANGIIQRKSEKLKCLLNYFARVTETDPTGTVTFHRQYLQTFPKWASSKKNVSSVALDSDGVIEIQGYGMLQVDFANKFVGGGVLSQGCVQEEIRFIICPELIISRLFTECLGASEVLLISGVEQFNRYSGYADDFVFDGDFQDQTPRDSWGRMSTTVVAMDALHYHNSADQFRVAFMQRELHKAFCGFYDCNVPSENLPGVATGNWGCGVYKGNPHLKFLLQLMAASEASRDILYFTFQNKKLEDEIKHMYSLIFNRKIKVDDIWSILVDFSSLVIKSSKKPDPLMFYGFFCKALTIGESDANDVESTSCMAKNGKMTIVDEISSDSTDELTDVDAEVATQNEPG